MINVIVEFINEQPKINYEEMQALNVASKHLAKIKDLDDKILSKNEEFEKYSQLVEELENETRRIFIKI